MEKITLKAIEELKKFRKCFKNTIDYQKYEINVFYALNERYIEAGKIIDEFERGQKDDTRKSNCNIPHVSKRFCLMCKLDITDSEHQVFCENCKRKL